MHKKLTTTTLLAGIGLSLFLTGCQTYTQETGDMMTAYKIGDMMSASTAANMSSEKNIDNKDTILYRLEQGAILRSAALAGIPLPADELLKFQVAEGEEPLPIPAARDFYLDSSLNAFNAAEFKVDEYGAGPDIKIGSKLSSTLSNQSNTPYRGRAYDKVLLNTYKALNYMQLGDIDSARVELNRALLRQREAVEENAKRIEEAQAIAEKAKDGELEEDGKKVNYDLDKAKEDPKVASALADMQAELDAKILQIYTDYVNPFAVYLDGLFYLYHGVDASDIERSRKSLERVAQMMPGNPFVAADLEAAGKGVTPSNVTYVIFETGMAPWREQFKIEIPTFIVTSSVSYVGAALPKLKYTDSYLPYVGVGTSEGTSVNTSVIADMDSVVAMDFKNEWPSILTNTMISTATKAALDAVVQKQAENMGWQAQLATKLVTVAAQSATNIADTRTWRTLPKQYQIARITTPADRSLSISTDLTVKDVLIEPGAINAVYVKSVSPLAPLQVSQFRIR
jgi:uncharacterized protein